MPTEPLVTLSLRLDDGRTFRDAVAANREAVALSLREARAVTIEHMLDGCVAWRKRIDVAATRALATETLRRLDTIDDAEHVAALSRALVADDWADLTDATVEARIALGDICKATGCMGDADEGGYCSAECAGRDWRENGGGY
jgi:hypothetical protein